MRQRGQLVFFNLDSVSTCFSESMIHTDQKFLNRSFRTGPAAVLILRSSFTLTSAFVSQTHTDTLFSHETLLELETKINFLLKVFNDASCNWSDFEDMINKKLWIVHMNRVSLQRSLSVPCCSRERGESGGPPELAGVGGWAAGGGPGGSGAERRPLIGGLPQGQAAASLGVEEQAVQTHEDGLPARTWVASVWLHLMAQVRHRWPRNIQHVHHVLHSSNEQLKLQKLEQTRGYRWDTTCDYERNSSMCQTSSLPHRVILMKVTECDDL